MGMETMNRLFRYPLRYEFLYPYFKDILEGANTLSDELINMVNFDQGDFFTLLPNEINLERIYEFKMGGILPQYEEIYNENGSSYQYIPNIDNELSEYIASLLHDSASTCIIDDVLREYNNPHLEYFRMKRLLLKHKNELYYKINADQANPHDIKKCLGKSTAFWHSLCILTCASFDDIDETLTLKKIKEICLKTYLIIVGAYDGEGYVFWERNKI
jgi:hypothetical protein